MSETQLWLEVLFVAHDAIFKNVDGFERLTRL